MTPAGKSANLPLYHRRSLASNPGPCENTRWQTPYWCGRRISSAFRWSMRIPGSSFTRAELLAHRNPSTIKSLILSVYWTTNMIGWAPVATMGRRKESTAQYSTRGTTARVKYKENMTIVDTYVCNTRDVLRVGSWRNLWLSEVCIDQRSLFIAC